jgi:hypothetical protein
VGIARQLVGIVPGEEVTDGVRFAGVILPREQSAQLGLLGGNVRRQFLRLGIEIAQRGLNFGAFTAQFAQFAVGLGDRLLGFAQFLGGIGARSLRFGDVLLQRLDAALQVFQLLALDVGRGGEGARRRAKDEEKKFFQFFALPWLATACMAAAMAAWSPR